MDYRNNIHFFDKKYNETTKKIYVPSAALGVIAGLMFAVGTFAGGGLRMFSFFCWPFAIAAAVGLCIAFSRMVKESEITGQLDELIKQASDACNDKLGFPDNFGTTAITFTGCRITAENTDKVIKLKSGNYIGTEITVSSFYYDKKRVCAYRRFVSLVGEGTKEEERELSLADFDDIKVVQEAVNDKIRINNVKFIKDGAVVYEAPLMDNDYYKEEYFADIIHTKERLGIK